MAKNKKFNPKAYMSKMKPSMKPKKHKMPNGMMMLNKEMKKMMA